MGGARGLARVLVQRPAHGPEQEFALPNLRNFKDLQRTCRYEGGYHPAHPTVLAFWKVVHAELSPKEQRRLLLFATGSSRAPVGGLGVTRLLLQRAGPDSDSLPTSSTCFHAVLLPEYDTEAKLAHKIKSANRKRGRIRPEMKITPSTASRQLCGSSTDQVYSRTNTQHTRRD